MDSPEIRRIYQWFFAPLYKYKPETKTLREWYEYLFDDTYRRIETYKVVKPFVMPGLCHLAPLVKVQGVGYRQVKPGDKMWVRFDDRNEGQVEIEWQGGQGRKFWWYTVTKQDWESIRFSVMESRFRTDG